jgi:hypothetical protein
MICRRHGDAACPRSVFPLQDLSPHSPVSVLFCSVSVSVFLFLLSSITNTLWQFRFLFEIHATLQISL